MARTAPLMKALIHMKGSNKFMLKGAIFINKKGNEMNFNGLFEFSLDHNLPDSPFASPKASGEYITAFSADTLEAEERGGTTNNNLITGPSLAPFKSCYFQVPRYNITLTDL